jgi:hypothetical protein
LGSYGRRKEHQSVIAALLPVIISCRITVANANNVAQMTHAAFDAASIDRGHCVAVLPGTDLTDRFERRGEIDAMDDCRTLQRSQSLAVEAT